MLCCEAGVRRCAAGLPCSAAHLPIISLSIHVQVGEGKAVFDAAVKAVKAWQHLQLGETLLLLPLPALGAAPPGARQPDSSHPIPCFLLPSATASDAQRDSLLHSPHTTHGLELHHAPVPPMQAGAIIPSHSLF